MRQILIVVIVIVIGEADVDLHDGGIIAQIIFPARNRRG